MFVCRLGGKIRTVIDLHGFTCWSSQLFVLLRFQQLMEEWRDTHQAPPLVVRDSATWCCQMGRCSLCRALSPAIIEPSLFLHRLLLGQGLVGQHPRGHCAAW